MLADSKAAAEAAQAAANPIKGGKGWKCPSKEVKAKTEESDAEMGRDACNAGLCCGTAWSVGVEESDTIPDDGVVFHKDGDETK